MALGNRCKMSMGIHEVPHIRHDSSTRRHETVQHVREHVRELLNEA